MSYENVVVKATRCKGTWYVSLYDRETGKHIKKWTKGLQSSVPDSERERNLKNLFKAAEIELKEGRILPKRYTLPQDHVQEYRLTEAYDKALGFILSSDKSAKTKSDYKSHHKYFIAAIKDLRYDRALLKDFERVHIHHILLKMTENAKRGNAYYNKHMNICKAFFTQMIREFMVTENLAHGISEKPHRQATRKIPTADVQTEIINHFKKVYPTYLPWLRTLYHLKIRMAEMRRLKCGMVNTEKWYFDLPEAITKNGRPAKVIIPDDLRKDLEKMDLSSPDHFLFGRKYIKNEIGKREAINFLPSKIPVSTNASNKLWKEEVKLKLGYDIDQYSIAYKGANDKLRNGMTLDDVKGAYRQSDKSITRIYATEATLISMEKNKDKFGTFE